MIGRRVTPPTGEQIAETVADLDRLGVPVEATRAQAGEVLKAAGVGVGTPRLAAALNRRKAAAGLTPRNTPIAAAPSAEALAETVADLDRLKVPVHATGTHARAALVAAGLSVDRQRVDRAQSARRARDGVTVVDAQAQRNRDAQTVLAGLYDPRLLGAACVGRHQLFDDRHDREDEQTRSARHRAAQTVCGSCPVFAACRDVAAKHAKHIEGVWAGQLQNLTPQAGKVGRPRKEST